MSWLIILLSLYVLLLLILSSSFLLKSRKIQLPAELPFISVLIAARNEEKNIERCIEALKRLDYPKDKTEVLIGDDESTDLTYKLTQEAIAGDSRFRLLAIRERWGKAKGKANVLAQLARQAKGSYFFITDADIEVNPAWVKSLLGLFDAPTGVVSGFTIVKPLSFLTKLQSIDWLYYMGLLISFNRLKMDCTAVGNNMAVRKEAYEATGGYENIEFSVTEDFKLFKEIKAAGWTNLNSDEPGTLAWSQPLRDFRRYLHQRKRWIQGAMELPLYWKIILGSLTLFYPLLIALAFYDWKLALAFWGIKVLLQSFLTINYKHRLNDPLKINLLELLLFEFYIIGSTYLTAVFFVLPVKMLWKGREY